MQGDEGLKENVDLKSSARSPAQGKGLAIKVIITLQDPSNIEHGIYVHRHTSYVYEHSPESAFKTMLGHFSVGLKQKVYF